MIARDHRGALEYDWRTRFGMPLSAIGSEAMTITEAGRLVMQLVNDPATATAAAVIGWGHPLSREGIVLADLFDLIRAYLSEGRVDPHWIRPSTPPPPREIDHEAVAAALERTGHLGLAAAHALHAPFDAGGDDADLRDGSADSDQDPGPPG